MATTKVADKPPTRSQRRLLDAARTVVGEDAGVRAAVVGRANARWSQGARWTVGIFTSVFALGLVLLHVILFPGLLVVLVLVETVIPRRCVVVTTTGVADLNLTLVRGRPSSVMAVTNHAALFDSRLEGSQNGKSAVPFGTERVSLRTKDLQLLRAAARAAGEAHVLPVVATFPPPPSPTLQGVDRERATSAGRDATGAGIVALVAAIIRANAYYLPWIVVRLGTVTTANNGSVVGAPVLSIGCSLAAMAIAVVYLAKRSETNAQLLAGIGIVAVVASLLSAVLMFEKISDIRSLLGFPGVRLEFSPGAGPWIQVLGAVGILIGGMWAVRIARRDRARRALDLPAGSSST